MGLLHKVTTRTLYEKEQYPRHKYLSNHWFITYAGAVGQKASVA